MVESVVGMSSSGFMFFQNMFGTLILNGTNHTESRQLHLPDADGTLLVDAPSDGTQYARKDGAWEAVAGAGQNGYFKLSQFATTNPNVITMKTNLPSGTVAFTRDGVGSYFMSIPSGWGIGTDVTKFMVTITECTNYNAIVDMATYGDGMGGLVIYFFPKNRSTNAPIELDGELKFVINKF